MGMVRVFHPQKRLVNNVQLDGVDDPSEGGGSWLKGVNTKQRKDPRVNQATLSARRGDSYLSSN